MSEVRVTEGGRRLLAYIRASGMSLPVWCERHGLDRIQVQRVVNGERWQRISVDFAHAIDRATEGNVRYEHFLSNTAAPSDSGPLPDADSGEHPAVDAPKTGTDDDKS